jgi:hypothetical protein
MRLNNLRMAEVLPLTISCLSSLSTIIPILCQLGL